MFEAVLSLNGLECWASDAAKALATTINVLDYRRYDSGKVIHNWVEVLSDGKDMNETRYALSHHEDVLDFRMSKLKTGILGVVKTRKCPVSSVMNGLSCIVTRHEIRPDGSSQLTIIAADRVSLRKLVERMEGMGYEVRVLKISSKLKGSLTAKQKRIVQLAFEYGYFDYPRRIRQRELAKLCGISSSSLSEILRRAEKGAVKAYLAE
jgi:predicted DNA binding protein